MPLCTYEIDSHPKSALSISTEVINIHISHREGLNAEDVVLLSGPLARHNGGLRASCALREEEQPPAAGQAERFEGSGMGGGSLDWKMAAAVCYERSCLNVWDVLSLEEVI